MAGTVIDTDTIAPVMDRGDWKPMNALQQLVADYLADNPDESYASIARRGGMSRSTVYAIAKRPTHRQTPHPDTITALAKGLQMPESRVRSAAGMAAGFTGSVTSAIKTERGRLIAEALDELDDERLESLARRARHLLAEMREEAPEGGN